MSFVTLCVYRGPAIRAISMTICFIATTSCNCVAAMYRVAFTSTCWIDVLKMLQTENYNAV